MRSTQENILIDRDLLSNLVKETSFLVAQARIWGKTEPECNMVTELLARVTAAINGKPFPAEGKPGLECPICHKVVDDADYWDGDMCLQCRLKGRDSSYGQPKPSIKEVELFMWDYTQGQVKATLRPMPPPPDSYLEEMYEDRTCLPDSGG